MQYKTIALELIQEQPELYERLRSTQRLMPSMDAYAIELKDLHEAWKGQLDRARPGSDPMRIASEAMELAVQELTSRLRSASETGGEEPPSLEPMMEFLRRHTPPA